MKKVTTIAVVATLAIFSFVFAIVYAQQTYHDELILTYPKLKGTKIDKTCLCCHFIQEGTGPRNPYGVMYENQGESDFTAFEKFDADGDGYTNLQELTAKTYPGDFSDSPTPKKFTKCVTFFTSKETVKKVDITICAVNGKKVDISKIGPSAFEKGGSVMVPWKPVCDTFGGVGTFVKTDGKGRLDVKVSGKVVAQLWVGKNKGKINGKEVSLKVAPEMKGANMMVCAEDLAVKVFLAKFEKQNMGKIWNYRK